MTPRDVVARLASAFRRPTPVVGATPADVVHAENKWRLLRYRARPEGLAFETPILLVPSLINRHYVLDLMPGKSFAAFLVSQGHDVFCLDWGTPGPEDRYVTFEDVAVRTLARALHVAAQHGAVDDAAHVLGYCLGGTLAAIHAALRPARVASLTLVAAPIRFDVDGLLHRWTNTTTFDLDALVDATGNVPWPLMQSAFHLLRPTTGLQKLVTLAERAWDDKFLDGFFAIETWGNDNVSFPGECYRTYIRELYQKDALVRGELSLDGRRVELADITCPVLAVTFADDHIVPAASASVIMERVGAIDKELVHLPGGHVGAMVSGSAAKTLWPRLSAWWAARDAG
ncbi:MAG: alpha/beta fold hydrolase [Deltaproteobacteria bacterium]|nr:alpha/beta fold hydrolase [Deltaproteobacteria bacterium]